MSQAFTYITGCYIRFYHHLPILNNIFTCPKKKCYFFVLKVICPFSLLIWATVISWSFKMLA